ncbi:hypothetical protein H0I54_02940 [Yersinia kristensenii]|uniref:hypothetical protein n=1 Tax=Yersinia kristensenii TaxID=28152 RepID=UPI001C60AF29|nr:hypothetical protein [Yersinia kristensenii]MBW5840766.1 hypothetical protein [Yersinia kristensenii]
MTQHLCHLDSWLSYPYWYKGGSTEEALFHQSIDELIRENPNETLSERDISKYIFDYHFGKFPVNHLSDKSVYYAQQAVVLSEFVRNTRNKNSYF